MLLARVSFNITFVLETADWCVMDSVYEEESPTRQGTALVHEVSGARSTTVFFPAERTAATGVV